MKRQFFITIFLFCISIPFQCFAVLPPEFYEQARNEATYHLQISLEKITVPEETPGKCIAFGKVERIFRANQDKIQLLDHIEIPIDCKRKKDEFPVGAVLWEDVSELLNAKFMELFLDQDFHVKLYQSYIIQKLSDQPVIGK